MKQKPILPVKTPASEIPMRKICGPFRFQFVIPGPGVEMFEDPNGNVLLQAAGGASVMDLVAGDNIEIKRNEEGKIVISAVDTAVDIAAGQNITIDIDPETGTAIINSLIGGPTSEHYKGVFDTPEDLIAFDTNPEQGDYGMIKQLVFSDGGDVTWNGQYKYCFYINGVWTVVDQMLTFTDDVDLLQQFYSVGGSSPVIYLHKIAQTGSFRDLRDVPIVATPVATVEGNTVTVTCETEGSEIWYSTDGSMPHVNGTKYTGPITASGATTYRFVGIKNGMINSEEAVVSADYSLEAPTIELDWHDGTVSMANPNESGTIYYTTDGTEPTDQSTAYFAPFIITQATTFKLVVIDNGTASPVTEQRYEQAQNVSSFRNAINMIIGTASIIFTQPQVGEAHYEMYDSTPTYESPLSEGTITFPFYDAENNPRYYSVRVFAEGYVPSVVRQSLENGMQKPTAPSISYDPETGMVSINREGETRSIQLSSFSTGCTIRYTLDGSEPTADSLVYSEPFKISGNVTVKAVLIAYGEYYSDVTTQAIALLDAPTAELDYLTGTVTMNNPNASGTIYYTTDGTNPTAESSQYSAPFVITQATTFKMVVIDGEMSSEIATQTFEQAEPPRISFRGTNGNYADFSTGIYKVLMTNPNSRGFITYTTDGSTPTSESTSYRTDFDAQYFAGEVTYKARVFHVGKVPSAVATSSNGSNSVDAPAISHSKTTGQVTITLVGNTSDVPLQTNLNVPEMGARIWYTTDGTTPSPQNGTLYTGPFVAPDNTETVKAMTECYSQYDSDVTSYEMIQYFEIKAANEEVTVQIYNELASEELTLYASKNKQDVDQCSQSALITTKRPVFNLQPGESLYLGGDPNHPNGSFIQSGGRNLMIRPSGGDVYLKGDINTLIDGRGGDLPLANSQFKHLFQSSQSKILSAPVFPSTIMSEYCYAGLFRGCNIVATPVLPSVQLARQCYSLMFDVNGDGIPYAPSLPASILPAGCYVRMFVSCKFDMSNGNGEFNFDNGIEFPITISEITYNTPYDLAVWMGNTHGFVTEPDAPAITYNDANKTATIDYAGNTVQVLAKYKKIYYTTDGTTPTAANGTLYEGTPISLSKGQMLKACVNLYDQIDGAAAIQNVYVPEADLTDDEVAIVVKNTASGELRYAPYTAVEASAIENGGYTLKPYLRFTRGKNSKPVFMHKDQTSGSWAEFNRYRLVCDTSAPGGFDWAVTINGAAKSGTVSWQAGDTLDSILAQLTPQGVSTYLVFAHVSGEEFIRITQGGYSNSTFTLSNNTGATLTDLSFYTKIGDVQQTETHRDWQAMNVDAMFPSLGFLAANTVQYAVNGYNLSHMCGGNETQYKAYYRTNGASSYLAENAVSNRMSEAAFNAMDGSGNADAQALYDKYDGSWDAYMEASMVAIDDANANGIEYQSYDNGDTQTLALASVTTMDFDGSYIPAFPCAAHVQSITDTDVANGKFNMNTEHELAVFMRDAKLDAINSAFDVLIAAGLTATKLSRTAYYYWSVARYYSYSAWFYTLDYGRLYTYTLYFGLAARALAYPVAQP